jgi:hypothetical protein
MTETTAVYMPATQGTGALPDYGQAEGQDSATSATVGDLYATEDLAACRGEMHGGDVPQPMAPTTGTGQGEPMPDVRRVWPRDPDAYDRSRGHRARGIPPGNLLDMAAEVERRELARFEVAIRLAGWEEELAQIKARLSTDPRIDGKNAEARAAQLRLLLNEDHDYTNAYEWIVDLRQTLNQADASLERARIECRLTEAWLRGDH